MKKVEFTFFNGTHGRVPWRGYETETPGLLVGKTPKMYHYQATSEQIAKAGPLPQGWSIFHNATGMRLDVYPYRVRKDALEGVRLAGTLPVDWTRGQETLLGQVRLLSPEESQVMTQVRNA